MVTSKFPARYDSLHKISRFVCQEAESAGLSASEVYAVELAVDEACANIIDHAYGGEDRGEITCTCQSTHKGLTVILRDRGMAFNPDDIPPPNLSIPLDELNSRGAGLYLMKKVMDEVLFEFNDEEGNKLTLIKYKGK